jgi:hypothetical protein
LTSRHGGGGDGQVFLGHGGHAVGQLQVSQVDRLTDVQLGQVDFDELGQVLRQAGHVQFSSTWLMMPRAA